MALHPRRLIYYGNLPVPYTSGWDAEMPYSVEICPHARMPALCQPSARGEGRPAFGEQHFCRQREVVIGGLCDVCAKPLRTTTKVSLSDARAQPGAGGMAVTQFEPLLHRECAVISLRSCPWLRGRVERGEMLVRQVTRWRPQLSVLDPQIVAEKVPGHAGGDVVGYAMVELLDWTDRDIGWLGQFAAAA